MRIKALIGFLFLCACTPAAATQTPVARTLQPYSTITPSATNAALDESIVTAETPLPSPTPFLYTVASGDTLSQIAEKFNVNLDALLAANPGVDPNAMPVGHALKIPSNAGNPAGEATPTPVPFPVEQITCRPTSDRALWCFVLIHNDSSDLIENVTASVTLKDSSGRVIATQPALLPLDILPPDQSLPLSAFFSPDVPPDARPQVQILTGIRLLPGDARYLSAVIRNTLVLVDWSGLTAQVSGVVGLPENSKPAAETWVAAVAYDAAGNVIGVRRWESNAAFSGGGSLPFSFMLSSLAGKIGRVEFSVEARP